MMVDHLFCFFVKLKKITLNHHRLTLTISPKCGMHLRLFPTIPCAHSLCDQCIRCKCSVGGCIIKCENANTPRVCAFKNCHCLVHLLHELLTVPVTIVGST